MFMALLVVVSAGAKVKLNNYELWRAVNTGQYVVSNDYADNERFDSAEEAVACFLKRLDPIETVWGIV